MDWLSRGDFIIVKAKLNNREWLNSEKAKTTATTSAPLPESLMLQTKKSVIKSRKGFL